MDSKQVAEVMWRKNTSVSQFEAKDANCATFEHLQRRKR
jgi:hypothetical protein